MAILVRIPAARLAAHPTARFAWRDAAGHEREGFVARTAEGAEYVAYENACPHLGTPLDWGDNRFFEESGAHFVCATHGALFRPRDGFCIAGPCAGDSLTPLRAVLEGEAIVVAEAEPPEEEPEA